MNKPNKCKNCQWYGKQYWSIINPCDNCSNETTTEIEILTRWQDPTIEEYKKEINIPENVLVALGDLTNGALDYYKATETVKVRHNTILDYITNLQEENKQLTNVRYSLDRIELEDRIDKAIAYLSKYNDKESNYYAPIDEVLDILKGEDK